MVYDDGFAFRFSDQYSDDDGSVSNDVNDDGGSDINLMTVDRWKLDDGG